MTKINIYNEDCIERMKKLPDQSVDFILADYPFNSQDGRKDYIAFVEETAKEFERLLKDDGNLLVLNNPSNIFKTAPFYQGFTHRNTICLIRTGSLRPAWQLGFQHNQAILLCKGDKKTKWNGARDNHNKEYPTDVIPYQCSYRDKNGFHPQAIPEDLTTLFIELLSNPGDVVLDPFLGSGTTAVCCYKKKRNFIGTELNKTFFELASKRIGRYTKQSSLQEHIKK